MRNWTREELIIVFNLYCKIPFKESSKNNPEVIKIAELIDRTPSAVNLKIGNFGSFDESLRAKGIVGLTHVSKLDEEIWNEFNGNWDKLAFESEQIIKQLSGSQVINISEIENVTGYDVEKTVKQRVNQDFFRRTVLSAYNYLCCVTGISTVQLLNASHIKPWRNSTPNEKVNPRNGLCLNALHDRAFDKGFMTVSPNGKIIMSKDLSDIYDGDCIERFFSIYENQKIILPEKFMPEAEFLEYHNDVIFENWK